MNRTRILIAIFLVIASGAFAQRSNVIAVLQLIETNKYEEAKESIEAAVKNKKTRDWPRTWYTRGVLCQTAYEEGIKKKEKKLYELYPEQLFTAHISYEKALKLDKHGRLDRQVAPHYVNLANDFIKMGQEQYGKEEYAKALKAFEHALDISKSPVLNVQTDTNLIYNTALAAYHLKKWEDASAYLQTLNEMQHSPNVAQLLFSLYLHNEDTTAAEEVLLEGIDRYDYDENMVLVLTEHLYNSNQAERAIEVLDSATVNDTANYRFPFTKGLILQKSGRYRAAITAYKMATKIQPDEVEAYVNIGNCYYNIGVEIKDNARQIVNNRIYLQERQKANRAFESAATWLEKAREKDPDNRKLTAQLNELYNMIRLDDQITPDNP